MVAIAGASTTQDDWHAWGGLDELRPAQWGPAGRVIVVAPHAGDEVLGLGGTMQLLASAGHRIEVVILDEHAAPPATGRVLDVLGVEPAGVHTIVLPADTGGARPDGLVGLEDVVERMADHLSGATWCLATWRGEGLPAHSLAGQVAARASSQAEVPLAEYLVDTWTWAAPGDGRVPWDRARRSAFDRRLLNRKEAAIERYRADHPAIQHPHGRVTPEARASLLRSFEVVLQPSSTSRPPAID